IPHPTFTVEYSIDIMPDYQQYVEAYQREHGTVPPEYQQTLRCYQLFAEEVKTKMPKLPFCRDYFALLGVINSLCYVYRTLEETGQEPRIDFTESGVYATFPKALPPIPVRYYRSYALPLTLKDVLSLLRSSDEKTQALDKALSLLFNSNAKIDFPVEVKQQLEAAIRTKILEMLRPQVTPQDLSELNEVDIANIVNQTTYAILTVARSQSARIHRALNKRIESFPWLTKMQKDALKKLPILAKIEQANKEQESHFQALKLRWEANPELATSELPTEFPAIAAAFDENLKKIEENTWVEARKQCGGSLTAAQEEQVKKFIAEEEQAQRMRLIEIVRGNFSEQFAKDTEFTSHFSNLFVTNPVLSEHAVSEDYTHSFVGFTSNDLAAKTGDNFRIVGGCGMSVPNLKSEPIPHAESFTSTVEKAFSHTQQEEARFEHNGTLYIAYRVPVVKKEEELRPASRLEWEYSLSMHILEAIHAELMSPRTFALNIGKRWVDDKGTTLMHRAATILKPSLLAELIAETEGALYLKDQYGNLPIHVAAESGNVKNIELMLQKAPSLLDEKNHRGVTPLIVATQYGQLEVIQLLHAKGANFNYLLPNGLFPLYMAIQKNLRVIALWMLDNVPQLNVNQELDSQMTALHLAIQGEETELALKLIARGARCDIRRKSDGFTALHCAAKEGNVKVLAAILATPISVNLALESKKTPLMLAAEAGQLEAVKLLIQKGGDVNAVALNGETPLMLAICAGRKEVA
ncbi:MAG: ankyrin repeat domain-containing protein, partial [Gammaproteobacteria bacterium]|nr:ankyrin repeat domain-containing protein [Gammaproteobacteria bacterium]